MAIIVIFLQMLNSLKRNILSIDSCLSIKPYIKGSFKDQLEDCYKQVKNKFNDEFVIIKLIAFVNTTTNKDFQLARNHVVKQFSAQLPESIPLTIVPQPPVDGTDINIEVWMIEKGNNTFECKRSKSFDYLVIENEFFKKVISSGISLDLEVTDIYKQSVECLKAMSEILKAEEMDFGNIIRQWNYIEDITGFINGNQHYQIFNDVRSAYYSSSKFTHGYPAATGIGMSAAGVITDFIASKVKSNYSVWPVKSPVQTDAHQYSKEVLENSTVIEEFNRSTPKFERAKVEMVDNSMKIYVSGTAAIKGQISQAEGDAYMQTAITLQNINVLADGNNIARNTRVFCCPSPEFLRVYIKNVSDVDAIKKCINDKAPGIPVIFVQADVCRPELLVEIEALYNCPVD